MKAQSLQLEGRDKCEAETGTRGPLFETGLNLALTIWVAPRRSRKRFWDAVARLCYSITNGSHPIPNQPKTMLSCLSESPRVVAQAVGFCLSIFVLLWYACEMRLLRAGSPFPMPLKACHCANLQFSASRVAPFGEIYEIVWHQMRH